MIMPRFKAGLLACVCAAALGGGAALVPASASEPDPRWTWDLTTLYADHEAWDADRRAALDKARDLAALEGTLGDGSDAFLTAMRAMSDAWRTASRAATYAHLVADGDMVSSDGQRMRQQYISMVSELQQAAAWIDPEIIALGEERVRDYLDAEPELAPFRRRVETTLRRAPHTLGDEAERVLAAMGPTAQAPYAIYGLLSNTDIPRPTVTMSTGEEALIDMAGYARWRAAENREDRKAAFDAYWGSWEPFESSVGAGLNAHVQTATTEARLRGYDSALSAALSGDNVPDAVYRTLVEQANDALPVLHRYFALRGRMLGVENPAYYDIYPDLVQTGREYPIEDAIALTGAAIAPLGDEYVGLYQQAMSERWMDVHPRSGKTSGAYMSGGAYDAHPFVLLNHLDDFTSTSTFAHEWGHALHSVLANDAQPFETASYATFTAEVASTVNEFLLQEHMLANAATDEDRLFYLGYGLELLRATFFRQTMFAEFELALHETVESGEPLTGGRITEIYADTVRRYHGHEEGVLTIEDAYTREWMFVPHFYMGFYVYQYATSLAAAAYFTDAILDGDESVTEAYLDALRAGGSDDPYQILLDAGVDLAAPEPYQALVARMERIMDEMEEILSRREAAE